ncbi:MAG: ABC transporter ATP-binding protein/permease, partial [Bryobacter sp.]|nr:ABC transporter ATP-binding protein/permease [Bryobacter sp.]
MSRAPQDWEGTLRRAADLVGLVMHRSRRSSTEVLSAAGPKSIWLRPLGGEGRLQDILAVVDGGGRRGKAVLMTDPAQERMVTRSDLDALLAPDRRESGTWLAVEPAAPLAPIVGQHDHHGHEHTAWHGEHPYQRLKAWMRAEKSDLWVAVIYSAAVGLLSLVVPIATQALVNTIAFGMLLQPLVVLAVLVLIGLLCAGILQVLRFWVVEVIQRRVFVRIATDVIFRLLRVRIDAFDKGHGPELVNRFFEVVTVQKSGASLIVDGLTVLMTTLVGVIVLAVYHPLLLGFAVILLSLVYVILFPLGSGAVDTSVRESKAKYALAAWLEEVARFPVSFKSASGTTYALDRTDALSADYLRYRGKHFRILLRQNVALVSLQALATAFLLGAGGWLVMQQQLTLGQLIAAELIVTAVVAGVAKFGKQLETFYDLLAAVDKLGYFTDLPLERAGSESLAAEGPCELRLRGVTFAYEGRPALFERMELLIPRGARAGIACLSGSGKTSLMDLLYGLRSPDEGLVEIDGRDFRELRLADLRSQIALLRQPEIFHGTIADNVRLGNLNLTSADVREALQLAGLLDEVLTLPGGLDTELTTGGLPLSQSQQLRLMLARAVVGRPRLLLIDEALDSIDDPQ